MNPQLYNVSVHIHSVTRWIVLLLLLFAIFNSLIAGNRPFIKSDNRSGLLLMIFADTMLLLGLFQYFVGPWGYKQFERLGSMGAVMKDPVARFFAVEHIAGMLIAITLIHIGKAQARRAIPDKSKHNRTMLFYFIALVVILVSIPWPFRVVGAGRGWY